MLHPRVYGTYTTLLEHFVREKQALSIESAVHKCTGRAAKIMGLKTKGILAPGMDADLNIFDLSSRPYLRNLFRSCAFSPVWDTVFVAGRPA
ncbi:MAG: amidohydrolase family protein, partial [Oscillospiraceae bacterium]